jgi:hypothetical protein
MIKVQGQHRQTVHKTTLSKIITPKQTGGVAQVVECLLCKFEALSSNSNPTEKEKRKTLLNTEMYLLSPGA